MEIEKGDRVKFNTEHPNHEKNARREGRVISVDEDKITIEWSFENAGRTFTSEEEIPEDKIIEVL